MKISDAVRDVSIYVGDWVAFMQNNQIVIGEVRYIVRRPAQSQAEVVTSAGCVAEGSVLEIRHDEEKRS